MWGTQVLAWRKQAICPPLYSGTRPLRLSWRLRSLAGVAAVLCALAVGGCSFQLHSLLSKDEDDVDTTGSIGGQHSPPARQIVDAAPPAEVDLAYARAAASDVLAHTGKDSSVPWQNPNTGAGGNITPLASSHTEGGLPCRDFLASYEHGGSQDWLRGAACRTRSSNWEVRSLKPSSHPDNGIIAARRRRFGVALRTAPFIPH